MKNSFLTFPFVFICLLFVCSSAVYSDGKLETKTFLNNHLEIKIPAGFEVVNNDITTEQYSSDVMSSMSCVGRYTVPVFTITQYKKNLSQDSIEIQRESMVSQLSVVDSSATLIRSGVKVINGQKVGYMEYIVYGDNYLLEFFTYVDGRYVTFKFICLTEQKKWMSASKEMMQSMKVK